MAATYAVQRTAGSVNIGPSEAARNAESLFESSTVAEIREVETKTSTDIEEKKKQLRQLVGNSYRDLISSADTILAMASCCDEVVSSIQQIKGGFGSLAGSMADKQNSQEASTAALQRKSLYALGSRIKYLVDTSEMLWGSLDAGDVLSASLRFLRASTVHDLLMSAARPAVTSRFPLVAHQWPAIEKFKGQIGDRIGQALRLEGRLLTTEAASSALAAAAFLQSLTPSQALDTYLSARQACLQQALQSLTTNRAASVQDVTLVLTACTSYMQDAIYQAGELVLPPPLGEGIAQLPACVAGEASMDSELMFGAPLAGAASTEADAWLAVSAATVQRVTHMTQGEVGAACSSWLASLADDFARAGPDMLHACASAADLAQVEASVRSVISAWSPPQEPAKGAQQADRGMPETWQGVCDWAIGRQIHVWNEVLEAAFLKHAKALISAAFTAFSHSIDAPLDQCLHDAAISPAAPAGSFCTVSWPACLPANEATHPSTPHDGAPVLSRQKSSVLHVAHAAHWRSQIGQLHALVDEGLWQTVRDASLLCSDMEPRKSKSSYGITRDAGHRKPVLEAHIQELCRNVASNIAAKLSGRLYDLLQRASSLHAAPALIEQALVLARLATLLSGPDTWLRLVLGPPGEWQGLHGSSHQQQGSRSGHAEPVGSFTRRRSGLQRPAVRSAPAAEFQQLQKVFRDVARTAHEHWALWAAHALSQQLQQHLASDAAMVAEAGLRGWQETVIPPEDGGSEEVRFWLPGMPSPGVMLCLLSAVGELHRAGGPALGMPVVQALAYHLSLHLVTALRSLLQPEGHLVAGLSEKGVLQLLMDVRFLQQALAGGRPEPSLAGDPSAARESSSQAMQKIIRVFEQLESDLQERLDPIDWAMYEPFLWANASALQQRLGVLFGAFLHMQGTPPEVMAKAAAGAEANILRMAPTAQRFPYLPISTPASAAAGMRRLPGSFPASPKHGGWDQAAAQDYSFAGIITTRDDDVSEASRAADAATASAMDALQSRWNTQKLGAFGSMLGDKAAEVTAMAQQSLGDASLHSAFTSAFSHLQAGAPTAGGLLSSLRGFKQPPNLAGPA